MTNGEQASSTRSSSTTRSVLTDANVLWGRFTQKALLNLDKTDACEIWRTEEILSELERNLTEDQWHKPTGKRLTKTQIDRIVQELRGHGGRIRPAAQAASIAAIGTEYTSDEDDRHLLATCVEHGIGTLITEDKGFDVEACAEGFGIEIITTDEFLLSLWDTKFSGVVTAIAGLLGEFADQYDLARSLFEGCPRFEALVRAHFGLPPL